MLSICMSSKANTKFVTSLACVLFVQIEDAIIWRKKQELLERYASDELQTQVEESKKLAGL